MEEKTPVPTDHFNSLRNKAAELPDYNFKRKTIGGFDENEVTNYISGIRQRVKTSEESFKKCIEDLTNSKEKLKFEMECQIKDLEKRYNNLHKVNQRLEEEKAGLQTEIEKLRSELLNLKKELENKEKSNEIEGKLSIDDDSRIAEIQEQLDEANRQLAEQQHLRAELEHQLEAERIEKADINLETVIMEIKDGLAAFNGKIEDLGEFSKVNNELKEQLMKEKVRADQAEKELNEFGQLVSVLEKKISQRSAG
ncbi:MAG: hypothetical protein CVU89_15880 [Firmicutes bacterium HGW-Firmicutes-14]|nr:MAG: hypothetical protein CVU89_15880 [Firmicutes bacterium HGW-Firmicutes-14]